MFYANEHEPVHVHGKCQGRESKAELIVINGMVAEIRYGGVAGRMPLSETAHQVSATSSGALFHSEVANALLRYVRAGVIDKQNALTRAEAWRPESTQA